METIPNKTVKSFAAKEVSAILCRCSFLLVLLAGIAASAAPCLAQGNYTVSWLANNFSGGTGTHVPDTVHDLFVWTDGTIFTNSSYDEIHASAVVYKSGAVLGTMNDLSIGGRNSGGGITTDGNYVYVGMSQNYQGYAAWSQTTTYSVGSQVAYEGSTYKSLQNSNLGQIPSSEPSYWSISNAGFTNLPGSASLPGGVLYAVRRYSFSPTTASGSPPPEPEVYDSEPFAAAGGAYGEDGSMVVINQTAPTTSADTAYNETGSLPLGFAILGSTLYVVDYHQTISGGVTTTTNQILAYNTSSLSTAPTVLTQLPTNMIVTQMVSRASDSTLWLAAQPDGTQGSTAHVYQVSASTGTVTDMEVPNLVSPTGLAFDTKNGELMVADNGPNVEQILFLNVTSVPATVVSTFGNAGGIFNSSSYGEQTTTSFLGLVGVGMDAAGNLTVAENGGGKQEVMPAASNPLVTSTVPKTWSDELGCLIYTYIPSGSTFSMSYQYHGHNFINSAAINPGDEGQVYGLADEFFFQYTDTPTNPAWSLIASTLDPVHYPQDPRFGDDFASVKIRFAYGKGFMFLSENTPPGEFMIYRFHGNVAIPSTRIHYQFNTASPLEQPGTADGPAEPTCEDDQFNPYTWRDLNGDGAFESNEYVVPVTSCFKHGNAYATFADTAGTVWIGTQYPNPAPASTDSNSIFKFAASGLDSYGNLIYPGWDAATAYPVPTSSGWVDPTPYQAPHFACSDGVGWQCSYPVLTGTSQYIKTNNPSEGVVCLPDFCLLQRLLYDPTTDTMFLAGQTAADLNIGFRDPNSVGGTLVRYNNWSTTHTLAWAMSLPYALYDKYGGGMGFSTPESIDLAGDLVFVGYVYNSMDSTTESSGAVLVINALTGATVESMERASTMEPGGGRLDMVGAISAYQRSTAGDYIVLEEEDNQAKLVEFDLQYGESTDTLSSSATTAVAGTSITLTTSVASIGTVYSTPTGTVSVVDTSNNSSAVCSGTLSSGTVACSTSSLAVGTHVLKAQYSGDSTHMPFLSNTVIVVIQSN